MFDMEISSDFGLVCGNYVITPTELARLIEGIELEDGLLVIEGVKFVNREDKKYIVDQLGIKYTLDDLMEAA